MPAFDNENIVDSRHSHYLIGKQRNRPMSPLNALVILTAIQIFTSYAATVVLTISPILAMSFQISPKWVGGYTALLYGAAAVSSIFFGNRVHRFGSFQVSRICLGLCAVAMLLLGTGNIGAAIAGSILMGFGYGGITPASSYFLSQSAPMKNRSLLFSIRQSGVPAGAALAAVSVPLMTEHLGVMLAFCLPGAIGVVATTAFRHKSPVDGASSGHQGNSNNAGLLGLLSEIAQLRILVFVAFVFSGLQVTTIAMLVPYLHGFASMSVDQAAGLLTLFNVVGVAFRLIWGRCVDRGWSALQMLGISGLLGALGFVIMGWSAFAGATTTMLYVAAGTLGMAVVAWNGVLFSEIAAIVPKHKVGQATGLCVFAGFIGVVVIPTILTQSIENRNASGLVFVIGAALSVLVSYLTLRRGPRGTTQ
jgi:MFS family permease